MSILTTIILSIALALLVCLILSRFNLPIILSYILAGLLAGPFVLKWIPNTAAIHALAEFGVVFLLFSVGLEFSLMRVFNMATLVFGLGSLQIGLTILSTCLFSYFIDLSIAQSILVGSILAMSSTAIVMKQLNEHHENTENIKAIVLSILLFQDLFVVPLLILIPNLAHELPPIVFFGILALAFLKGIFALLVFLLMGHFILKPLFYAVAERRSLELFTLTVLFVTLTASWLTFSLGLSHALGAFIAGMMLSESEFRHQIEEDIRPFRDLLLGLFFLVIGMQVDFRHIFYAWPWILLTLSAIFIFKTVLIRCLAAFFKIDKISAWQTGLVLAQGSEFGFAILLLSEGYHILPEAYEQVLLGALLISLAIAPLLIQHAKKIISYFIKTNRDDLETNIMSKITLISTPIKDHVILCGYGRIGQNIAKLLERSHIPTISLDLDATRVREAQEAQENVFFADASHVNILEAAGLKNAQALVISFHGQHKVLNMVKMIHQKMPKLPIFVRSYEENEMERLLQAGAKEVIPEYLEASLALGAPLLLSLNIPPIEINYLLEESRNNHYELFNRFFPNQDSPNSEAYTSKKSLMTCVISKRGQCLGKTRADLSLPEGMIISSIIRNGKRHIPPFNDFLFEKGDIIVLYGERKHLALVEDQV